MLEKISVKNYKSLDTLEVELGRVNLFVGENGSGKSNMLEAIALGAASAAGKLDNDYLISRGIRVTDPERMTAGFASNAAPIDVEFFGEDDTTWTSSLHFTGGEYGRWTDRRRVSPMHLQRLQVDPSFRKLLSFLKAGPEEALGIAEAIEESVDRGSDEEGTVADFLRAIAKLRLQEASPLPRFITYTPHEEALRDLSRESYIEPIGIHGEGLYRLLESLNADQLALVKEQLALIHWFEDLHFTPGQNPAARSLKIVDQYLGEGLRDFDQRSANEGFLFVLLYACLLISEDTPRFFAVDNVDTALNPKLCAGVVRMFAALTKSQDRQVILTAHNPGALDGLDLRDDDQRLFVVSRNVEGRTRARRIEASILDHQAEPLRLSEAFLRGYLGGLPEHF